MARGRAKRQFREAQRGRKPEIYLLRGRPCNGTRVVDGSAIRLPKFGRPNRPGLLGNIQVGRLTPPEVTAQGLQMFAVCNKKESATDSPQKREMREQLFVKRFESESKKYLDEIRKAAMIEYKNNK